jgi:hypothetical protein
MQSRQQPRRTQRKFGTIWGELSHVCDRIHRLLYSKRDKATARRLYLSRLERILENLPENDMAILRAEGLAQLNELKGNKTGAIKHRKREIELMQKLHEDVEARDYDERTKAAILVGRDKQALQQRRAILQALKREEN